MRAPTRSCSSSRKPCTRTRSGPWWSSSGGELYQVLTSSTPTTTTPTSGAPHRVEFGDPARSAPPAPRLHSQRGRLGRARRRGARARRSAPRPGGHRSQDTPRCRRPRGTLRGKRAPDGSSGSSRGGARVHDRARHPGRHRIERGPRPLPVRRAHLDRTVELLGAGGDRSASAARLDPGLLERIAPELARQRGMPQDKAPGKDLWEHRSAPSTPPASTGWRPARGPVPRHRQAGDVRRRPLHWPRHRRGGARRPALDSLRFAAGGSRAGRRAGAAAHVQLRAGLD